MTPEEIERKAFNQLSESGYPNPLHVFQISSTGIPYLNQEPITNEKLSELKQEAGLFRSLGLYTILQESLKEEAYAKMVQSKNWEEVLAAKAMLENLRLIRVIVEKLQNAKTEVKSSGSDQVLG